jgi:hypothetical protein
VTTHERVQNREEFRNLLDDVSHLPETQRSALLLREIDAMSYEEIALAMDTTVPGVKSLLVRARIALAESSQARQLTCDDVRLELAEAAEGIAKVTGPVRRHLKACDPCREFRTQLRSDTKALAAIFPAGPLLLLKGALVAKLTGIFGGGGGAATAGAGGGGGAAAGAGAGAGAGAAGAGAGAGAAGAGAAGAGAAGAGAAGAGAAGAGAAAAGSTAAIGGAAAAGGAAAGGGAAAAAGGAAAAIGTKAAAGIATAAIIAGGAAEVQNISSSHPAKPAPAKHKVVDRGKPVKINIPPKTDATAQDPAAAAQTPPGTTVPPTTPPPETVTVPPQPTDPAAATGATTGGTTAATTTGRHKHHKNAVANSDSQPKSPAQTGPVTTGVEPATCDADGDGVVDAGAPSSCTTPPAPTTTSSDPDATGVIGQGAVKPPAHNTRKHKSAPKKKVRR